MRNTDAPSISSGLGREAARPLRVALVTETYPPEVNGVAMTVARLIEGMRRRDHAVQLIRPRQAGAEGPLLPDVDEFLVRGLAIPRYPHLQMGVPSTRGLAELWTRGRPDVVHIATQGPLGWSALRVARRLGIPATSDFRTNFQAYSRHYGLGGLHRPIMAYLRGFHNRTAATMVPTEALRRELAGNGFRGVTVVSRGVDTARFHPARRRADLRRAWGAAEDDPVVLCVGRLAAEKNLMLLRRAFEAIRAQVRQARLVLVGDGPQRLELQRGMPEAVFAGQRVGDDLAAHYASADLFLFPSVTETFGNVTTEAMASGLPVLAFDYAAASELVTSGRSGLLVPLGDEPAFEQAAARLAGQTASQRTLMGLAARERALAQDWSGIIARFEGVLLHVFQSSTLHWHGATPLQSVKVAFEEPSSRCAP